MTLAPLLRVALHRDVESPLAAKRPRSLQHEVITEATGGGGKRQGTYDGGGSIDCQPTKEEPSPQTSKDERRGRRRSLSLSVIFSPMLRLFNSHEPRIVRGGNAERKDLDEPTSAGTPTSDTELPPTFAATIGADQREGGEVGPVAAPISSVDERPTRRGAGPAASDTGRQDATLPKVEEGGHRVFKQPLDAADVPEMAASEEKEEEKTKISEEVTPPMITSLPQAASLSAPAPPPPLPPAQRPEEPMIAALPPPPASAPLPRRPAEAQDPDAVHEEMGEEEEVYAESDEANEQRMADVEAFNPYLFIKRLPPYHQVWKPRATVLPPQPRFPGRKTLVLDLDETLVHCTVENVAAPDVILPVCFNGVEYRVCVRKRPFLNRFLEAVAPLFEVVVFTASQRVYADALLDTIDPDGTLVHHRLFREACLAVDGNFLKDLNVLGRDLSSVILVDNSPHCYGYQLDNGVPIISWYEDTSDTELLKLLGFLQNLADHSLTDVRPILRNQFRTHVLVEQAA